MKMQVEIKTKHSTKDTQFDERGQRTNDPRHKVGANRCKITPVVFTDSSLSVSFTCLCPGCVLAAGSRPGPSS